jgi:hypothetical protein
MVVMVTCHRSSHAGTTIGAKLKRKCGAGPPPESKAGRGGKGRTGTDRRAFFFPWLGLFLWGLCILSQSFVDVRTQICPTSRESFRNGEAETRFRGEGEKRWMGIGEELVYRGTVNAPTTPLFWVSPLL